jgi:uncharacterized HAD superfamily protein
MNPQIYAVDMDGTLTKGVCWTVKDCLAAKMDANAKATAGRVRKLYLNNFIIIYTARRDHLIAATMRWLRLNDIPFHAISNNKMPANWYVDDRAINPRGNKWPKA